MTLLTKDQILGADDTAYETVKVEEWGGEVRIGAMSAYKRDAFEASMLDNKGKGSGARLQNFRAKFVAACIVDADGKLLFTSKDIVDLGKKSAAPVSRIFDACRELNGMTEKDMDEIEGN